jgi:membrane associated rhomboid family serine protease
MFSDVSIPLKRTPLWNPSLALLSAISAACGINTAFEVAPSLWAGKSLDAEGLLSVVGMTGWLSVVAIIAVKRFWVRRRPLGPIRLTEHAVHLPRHSESTKTDAVRYSDIVAVGEGGRPPKRHFFIESRRRIYFLPQRVFDDAAGPERLFSALKERLHAQPQGAALLLETDRKRQDAWRAMGVRPMATHALLGIIVVFFLNTWLKGATTAPFGLLRWGANAPALVYQGELYRLAAANFLHAHWLHVIMNVLALWYLGSLLERLLGWARFAILYLVAGTVAMMASAYTAGAVMSVGASGAIFGLLGGFACISVRLRETLPLGVRQTPRWWLTMLGVNTLLPLLWPVVDITAHLAGFVTGACVTMALLGLRRTLPQPAGIVVRTIAYAIIAVYVVALGIAVKKAADTTASGEIRFGQLLLADTRTSPQTLNTLAWLWVIDPSSTQEHLLAAKDAALSAVRREPDVPEYQATLATVCQRLKDVPCSIEAWRRATEAARPQGDESIEGVIRLSEAGLPALYAIQFARMLQMAKPTDEALQGEANAGYTTWHIEREGNVWRIVAPAPQANGHHLYLLGLGQKDVVVALVHMDVPPMPSARWVLPTSLGQALGEAGVRTVRVGWLGRHAPSVPVAPWTLWRIPTSDEPEATQAKP